MKTFGARAKVWTVVNAVIGVITLVFLAGAIPPRWFAVIMLGYVVAIAISMVRAELEVRRIVREAERLRRQEMP